MRVRNDLNCGTWDYQYNQQLDSQSRVWTWRRWLLGNIIIPDSCGRGLGAFSKIYLFDAWEKTRIEDRRRGLGRIRNIDKIELNFPGKMKLFPTGISNLGRRTHVSCKWVVQARNSVLFGCNHHHRFSASVRPSK